MKHGIFLPPFGTFGDPTILVDLAVAAEGSGWDGFFLWDHVLHRVDGPYVDAWIALAAIAARTDRLRIGPLVTPLPRRRPWKLAREAVSL
ncbi:MAG: LLM class flavin-dependent oxidoreductase, partial [Acidimicrobiia bacterium]